jgi:TolB protein
MSQIKPMTRRTWLAIATGLMTCIRLPQATAQSGTDGQRPISISVPDFSGDPASGVSPRNVTELITSDLKASDRLMLIEPNGLVEENLNAIPHFDKWRGIHTDHVVTGRITRAPDQRVKVEFRLWDVVSSKQLVGAQYMLQPEDWRGVAHAIAEAVIQRLVG